MNFQHAARQAYIGLSAALMAAAFEGVDSTPMEGFDPKALDDIWVLRARGLRSVAIMPLGYRLADKDWLVNLPKVRRPPQRVCDRGVKPGGGVRLHLLREGKVVSCK